MEVVNLNLVTELHRQAEDARTIERFRELLGRYSALDAASILWMVISDEGNRQDYDWHRGLVIVLADWMACQARSLPEREKER